MDEKTFKKWLKKLKRQRASDQIEALQMFNSSAVRKYRDILLPKIRPLLDSPSPYVRRELSRCLANFFPYGEMESDLVLGLRDERETVRDIAIGGVERCLKNRLEHLFSHTIGVALFGCSQLEKEESHSSTPHKALEVLGLFAEHGRHWIPMLKDAVESPSTRERSGVLLALRGILAGDVDYLDDWTQYFRELNEPNERRQCALAIGEIAKEHHVGPGVFERLVDEIRLILDFVNEVDSCLLGGYDVSFLNSLIHSIGDFGVSGQTAAPLLMEFLTGPLSFNRSLIQTLIRTLGAIEGWVAVPVMIPILDGAEYARNLARHNLVQIGVQCEEGRQMLFEALSGWAETSKNTHRLDGLCHILFWVGTMTEEEDVLRDCSEALLEVLRKRDSFGAPGIPKDGSPHQGWPEGALSSMEREDGWHQLSAFWKLSPLKIVGDLVWSLGALGHPCEGLLPLLRVLFESEEEHPEIRMRAALSLVALGEESEVLVHYFLSGFSNPSIHNQKDVSTIGLSLLPEQSSLFVPTLLESFRTSTTPWREQGLVVRALGSIEGALAGEKESLGEISGSSLVHGSLSELFLVAECFSALLRCGEQRGELFAFLPEWCFEDLARTSVLFCEAFRVRHCQMDSFLKQSCYFMVWDTGRLFRRRLLEDIVLLQKAFEEFLMLCREKGMAVERDVWGVEGGESRTLLEVFKGLKRASSAWNKVVKGRNPSLQGLLIDFSGFGQRVSKVKDWQSEFEGILFSE